MRGRVGEKPPRFEQVRPYLFRSSHLFIAGGRNAGLCFLLSFVLVLGFPESAIPKEALVQFQFIARFLPAHAAFHVQPMYVHCDVLNVFRRDPGPAQYKLKGTLRNAGMSDYISYTDTEVI